jgi:hypothetical protein
MDHIQVPRKKTSVGGRGELSGLASLLKAFLEELVIWFPGFVPSAFLLISHLLLNLRGYSFLQIIHSYMGIS